MGHIKWMELQIAMNRTEEKRSLVTQTMIS